MKKRKDSDHQPAGSGELFPSDLHGIHVNEARAQIGRQAAEGIREDWATTVMSDAEILVKLVEARYARESSIPPYNLYNHPLVQHQAMQELLRKAALDGPVDPPKHARFAVFMLPRSYQHIIFGDLEEQYPMWVEECGQLKATFLYWWQFLLSTVVLAWPRMRSWRYLALALGILLEILKKWR